MQTTYSAAMSATLSRFLSDLFASGIVQMPAGAIETDRDASLRVLRHRRDALAQTLAAPPPALDEPVALDAAVCFASLCASFATGRPLPPLPRVPRGPSQHWSGDLSLSFVPDLTRLVRAARGSGPLTAALDAVAAQWPLACVGLGEGPIDGFWDDPALQMLYVDRAIERGHMPSDPRAASLVTVAAPAARAEAAAT